MADFKPAYDTMIRNEGGYVNHTVAGDRGGQTYAGIARAFHSDWLGWALIDRNQLDNPELTELVFNFYKKKFWEKINGNEIKNQRIAESIFDFAVNAGVRTAVKLVQLVVDTTPDGIVGINTVNRINQAEEELFVIQYAIAKVTRYTQIVTRDRSQIKFLLGWLNRTLASVS